jgi:ketosteroid isomerase-like protein
VDLTTAVQLPGDLDDGPREIIQGRDGVFAAVDNSGRSKTGAEVEMRVFQVFRFREGMISYVTSYFDRQPALQAAGLQT